MTGVDEQIAGFITGGGRGLFRLHRRVVRGFRRDRAWVKAAEWRHPRTTGVLSVIGAGTVWGFMIGAGTGAAIGAVFLLIGAVYGVVVGMGAGLAVGVPSAVVLAGLLVFRHGDDPVPSRVESAIANYLAGLLELIGAIVVGLAAPVLVSGYPVWAAVVAIPATIGFAVAGRMLRRAHHDLVRLWLRGWGWRVIPPETTCEA